MKKFIIVALLSINFQIFGQIPNDGKRANTWMFGYPSELSDTNYLTFSVSFNTQPPSTTVIPDCQLNLNCANSVICDTGGNLLFYSNGMLVADRFGQIMLHGDSLSYNEYLYNFYSNDPLGGIWPYEVLNLPKPNSENTYCIIHQRPTAPPVNFDANWTVDKLLYSVVNMDLNGGKGDVTDKNVDLVNDTLDMGYVSACRHANGRDWWILVPKLKQPIFYRILFDPEGFHINGTQQIGTFHKGIGIGKGIYSNDGNIYARVLVVGHDTARIDIYDFDRNTGLFSNFRTFPLYDTNCISLAISGNSRFLYAQSEKRIYQFDLQALDIASTKEIVGVWDGYSFHMAPTYFWDMQLGPDNRIYGITQGPWFHVIQNPDIQGTGCNVTQRAFTLPEYNFSMLPNIPNFRLGEAAGIDDPKPGTSYSMNISPNPASVSVRIELDFNNNSKPLILQIRNILGDDIITETMTCYQGIANIDIRSLADGVYVAVLKSEKEVVLASKKFVVKK